MQFFLKNRQRRKKKNCIGGQFGEVIAFVLLQSDYACLIHLMLIPIQKKTMIRNNIRMNPSIPIPIHP